MARSTYDVEDRYTGTGSLDTYTFDFKIEANTQLLVIEVDDSGVETQRVLGDDVTYLSSVTFDAVAGGGTVVLATNLPNNYKLILLLANDAPTQPYEFKNKFDFTLKNFEKAFDFLAGPIQRLMYLTLRSVRVDDKILTGAFDPTLPTEITDAVSQSIVTKADGTGFDMGPTLDEITNAQSYALAAAASAAAAAASAASTWSLWVAHAVTDGQAATALSGESWLAADFKSYFFSFTIVRGTTIVASGEFKCHDLNGTWIIVPGSYDCKDGSGNDLTHGVTWSLSGTTTQQLNAALDVGAGNGTIDISSRGVPA